VRPRTLLVLVAAGFAVHLLLPQVGELRQTLGALQAAHWTWLVAGLALTAASYLAAAVAQLGAVDPPLALRRTMLVQLVGHTRLGAAHIPRGWPELVALAGVLAAGGLALWSPFGRRRLVFPTLRAGRELAGVLHRPGKAAQLLGGSAGVTLSYALALVGCLAAFGAHLPRRRDDLMPATA
jgi:undecaprenyl-diphosphatase